MTAFKVAIDKLEDCEFVHAFVPNSDDVEKESLICDVLELLFRRTQKYFATKCSSEYGMEACVHMRAMQSSETVVDWSVADCCIECIRKV